MADIIRLLPDSVANQIAAGEVIQRPASVVKELVENSVDAGATEIQVWITDAGKTCVQVIDNGKGMSEIDARLSFERHATSKIAQASDLYALTTMRFRGEALASIAAVAQVELRTKTEEMDVGVLLHLENSKITDGRPVACNRGTNFSVKNIFFNVPARRKFLKSDTTELRRIVEEFEHIALTNHQIDFSLYSNKTPVLLLPVSSRKQRIANVFGKRFEQILLPVKVETSVVKVEGFVVPPEHAVRKGAHQFFYVNNRYMRHPYFQKAVLSAYERLIPEGEQPHFFLFLEVEPSHIDVNVHPTKTEIKFENEQTIWQILLAAVKETLGKFNAVPTIDFNTDNMPQIPIFDSNNGVKEPSLSVDRAFNPFEKGKNVSERGVKSIKREASMESQFNYLIEDKEPAKEHKLYADIATEEKQIWESIEWECIQFRGQYIIAGTEEGLLIVDQHRAHIRILYDSFLAMIKDRKGASHGIMFPELLTLSVSQKVIFDKIADDLLLLGFDFSDLGGNTFAINGIPGGLEGLNPSDLVLNLLDTAQNKAVDIKADICHLIATELSKKASVPVGQYLSSLEMKEMLKKLFESSMSNYTPDGKLIYTILTPDKVGKFLNS